MSNYTIALAGLQNTSRALDAVSNNIANANTIGYKAGEYLFADQFIKAVNPADAARVGMGSQTQGVRRAMTQGTINNSQNPLDMAISGDGMFMLSENATDPTGTYYTRNGQFRMDSQGRIVNENGMHLMGFNIQDHEVGSLSAVPGSADTLMTLPPAEMFQAETNHSAIETILDIRGTAFTSTSNVGFDPTQSTYNSKTTQTVYDGDGNTHTLEVYYRMISAGTKALAWDSATNGWKYTPGTSSRPNTLGDTSVTINGDAIVRVDTAPAYQDAAVSYVSGTKVLTLTNTVPATVVQHASTGSHVFKNGVDTGAKVTAKTGSTVTLDIDIGTVNADDAISFYADGTTLNMTLVAPDGTEIPVTGTSNKEAVGTSLTAVTDQVEVYASFDGHFYDYETGYSADWNLTPQTNGQPYKPVAKIEFLGGKNIDALMEDPQSGNPVFSTITHLSNTVTQANGKVQAFDFDLDLTKTQLMAADFQVVSSVQDGEPVSRLTNVTIDNAGRIIGVYGNGKQYFHQQVALIHFDNYEGLVPVGNNAYAASVESGTIGSSDGVRVGTAGQGPFGEIKSMALEASNVDLANELVKLMVLQRSYTANSQSMRATDQMIRDTLQMSN